MITRILNADAEALACARDLIGKGDVVAFHTETVYGLGANAFDEAAIAKIFALKGRPSDNPLIAHVHRAYNIPKLMDNEPAYAAKLSEAFLPGPITMVYPSTGKVSALVSCGLNTLAIRVPSSPTAQAFLRAVDLPIAAPSANLSKHVSPVAAKHVYDDFCGRIPLILDGGACEGGIESTVLDCTGEVPVVLRAGLVTREMIASVAGACGVYEKRAGEKPKSPGMAYRHYSPKCRTAYYTDAEEAKRRYREEESAGGKPYILCAENAVPDGDFRVLDLGSAPEQMANRLYALLRQGENATLLIAIEPRLRGGVMEGVLNRFMRAFGRDTDEA